MLRPLCRTVALATVGALLFASMPAHAANPASLYSRLGGYDAIAAVTDSFIGRLLTDPMTSKFFQGLSKNSQMHTRQLIVDQLCFATGGPCYYLGRDMKSSHEGLGISEADWSKSVDLLKATLTEFKVPAAEQTELLAIASSLKQDIVEKP